METAKKTPYRYCLVPCCTNTTSNTTDKLFFGVPRGQNRNRWLKAMKRDEKKNKKLSATTSLWCCEDHFTVSNIYIFVN